MHFPSSLKLVGAMLLSALVSQAAPAHPLTQMMIKELKDPQGRTVWTDDPGYLFTYLRPRDDDPHGHFDSFDPILYAMYKTKGWEENGAVVEPVFGLTKIDNGEMIYGSQLPEDMIILKAGFYEERYWVVWTPYGHG